MGYLNETGLAYLWGKIKTHVATQLKNNVAAISSGGTGETTRSHAMNTLMNLGQSFTPPTSNDFDSWAALGTGGEWMQNVWADLPVEGIITQQVFESAWGRDTIFQLAINESGKLFYRYGEDAWDTVNPPNWFPLSIHS